VSIHEFLQYLLFELHQPLRFAIDLLDQEAKRTPTFKSSNMRSTPQKKPPRESAAALLRLPDQPAA
jgi:hypothetical protein